MPSKGSKSARPYRNRSIVTLYNIFCFLFDKSKHTMTCIDLETLFNLGKLNLEFSPQPLL